MQLQMAEGVAQHQLHRFGHVALAGKGRTKVIPHVCASKTAIENLAQVDRAENHSIGLTADEKAPAVWAAAPLQISGELSRPFRRRHQSSVKANARAIQRGEFTAVTRLGMAQENVAADEPQMRVHRSIRSYRVTQHWHGHFLSR